MKDKLERQRRNIGMQPFLNASELLTILAPIQFHDDISNGSRVMALTNTATHQQILHTTIPRLLCYRCVGLPTNHSQLLSETNFLKKFCPVIVQFCSKLNGMIPDPFQSESFWTTVVTISGIH